MQLVGLLIYTHTLSLFVFYIIYLFIYFFIYCNLVDSFFLLVFLLLSSLKLGPYISVLSILSFFILLCFLPLLSLQLYSSLTCFLSVFTTSIIFLSLCAGIMELWVYISVHYILSFLIPFIFLLAFRNSKYPLSIRRFNYFTSGNFNS